MSDDAGLALLHSEVVELQARLAESEETLAAIRNGDVDALVVGDDIYTLNSASAAENRLRSDVLAQMEDAVLAFDPNDHLIFMNVAAERQYRATSSRMLGRSKRALYVESWPGPQAEWAALDALHARGSYRAHSLHQRHDGSTLHVESTCSSLRDAKGSALGTLCVIRDISDRIRAEEALRETGATLAFRERQFSTLITNSPDIITRFDLAFRHLYVSPVVERYTGLPAPEFIGKTHAEVGIPAPLCGRWKHALEETVRGAALTRMQFDFATPAGEECFFDARLMPEFGDDGNVVSVLVIAADVTDQRRADLAREAAEAALRDADRRKDEFLATLAHELRNPLAPISNALQILRTGGEARAEKARAIIERQVRQMVHLVDDLLDVSRISQGRVELRRTRMDMLTGVQAAIETSQPEIDRAGHLLRLQLLPAGTAMVDADPTRLIQIVANLVNNAAKYTPSGGSIDVVLEVDGADARVSVTDSGIGIPEAMLPRVFDMFAQVERSTDRTHGGLGIGLAIVRQLAELHGGSIEARSAGPGRGSTFILRLPLAVVPAPAPSPGSHERSQPPRHECVLVVDDNVDSATSLAEVLALYGYQTHLAHEGRTAIDTVRDKAPDILLLDIGLPDMTGYEVARRLRSQAEASRLFIVGLSGWGQIADRRRSAEAGFDEHLVKPVDIEKLLDLIASRARSPR